MKWSVFLIFIAFANPALAAPRCCCPVDGQRIVHPPPGASHETIRRYHQRLKHQCRPCPCSACRPFDDGYRPQTVDQAIGHTVSRLMSLPLCHMLERE